MSVASLELLPDVERLVSNWLRSHADVVALVSDRVFTAWPIAKPELSEPACVLVTRIGGAPTFSRPLVLDECELQLDAYAPKGSGKKHAAATLAATVRRALAQLVDQVRPEGVVHGVEFGPLRYVPDESFAPARPRYVADVTVFVTSTPPTSGLVSSTLDASSGRE